MSENEPKRLQRGKEFHKQVQREWQDETIDERRSRA